MSPVKEFQKVPKWTETDYAFDVAGMKQPIDHVKNEQGLHSVIGKTFPSFGERDVTEPARVANKTAVLRIVHNESKSHAAEIGK